MNPRLITNVFFLCIELWAFAASAHHLPQGNDPDIRHFKFRRETSGKAMKKGGIEVSFARYSSENGILVERSQEDYRTHKAALAELGRLRRTASAVIQDGYKMDANGKRIGPRVELSFGRSSGRPEHTVVAWTDGSKLFLLRSESRPILLDFEEQDYPAVQPRSIPKRP